VVKTGNKINMFLYALLAEENNSGDTVNSSSYQEKARNNTSNFYCFSASFEQERLLQRRWAAVSFLKSHYFFPVFSSTDYSRLAASALEKKRTSTYICK